jgi:cytosine/adenosine deaminase-related metal-dependent hydrolase
VTLALGTDSLASNEDLDLRREMRLLREAFPWIAPALVWEMATVGGAAALGAAGEVGVLASGARADLVAHGSDARGASGALEELTLGRTRIEGVWVAGRASRARGGAAVQAGPPGCIVSLPLRGARRPCRANE